MKKIISAFVCICLVITLSLSSSATSTLTSDIVKSASGGYFSKTEYNTIRNEMHTVSSEMKILEQNGLVSSDDYTELEEEFQNLKNSLFNIGAVLDIEMLEKLPAPSSYAITPTAWPEEGDCDPLTGSLADLAEYYENWFLFCGYEDEYRIGTEVYKTFIVHVKDLETNQGLLTNTYHDVTAISKNEMANASGISEIASTLFGYAGDLVSGELGFGFIGSWAVSQMFSTLFNAINSGTIIIDQSNDTYYTMTVLLETQPIYVYLWDDSADEWIYCLSSSDIYVDEVHNFVYRKYVGASGSSYELETATINHSPEIPLNAIEEDRLSELAVGLYVSNNETIPTYSTSYQISELRLMRKRDYFGVPEEMGVFYPIICERPGDLWTLGH